MIFGKPTEEAPRTELSDTQNPYLAGRRAWNERYGDLAAQASAWRLTAIAALAIAAVATFGVVYIGAQNRVVPYVVQTDKLGDAVAVRRADVASTPDAQVIRAQLARFIADTRMVYLDAAAERNLIHEAYAMINKGGAAYGAMNDFFRTNDPFERAKREMVQVTVESVLPIAGNTWRAEWTEEMRSRDGALISSQHWQASLSIVITPPTTEKGIFANPEGIFVNEYSWSQRL